MIQELKVKNFKSFKDEITFSFEATKDDPANRIVEMPDGTKLLRFAVVYGANASGKSNLLEAFNFIREFTGSVPSRNDLPTRVIPFLLDKKTPEEDSVFELKFYLNRKKYWYKLELNRERVSNESVYVYDSVQPTKLFAREYTNGVSVIKFNPSVIKLKAVEADAINLNCWKNMSLFAALSKVNIHIEVLEDIANMLNYNWMNTITRDTELSYFAKNIILKDSAFKRHLMEFTNKADLRIEDLDIKEIPFNLEMNHIGLINAMDLSPKDKEEIISRGFINELQANFRMHVKNERGEEDYILPESSQSYGTNRVIEIEAALYTALKNNAFLTIDEIECSLHPVLLNYVLDRFINEAESEAQILVSTHYDPLLEDIGDLFGPDSVWFTEKKENGNSELYSLSDFKGLKKLSSIYKTYKNGQFGAIPEIFT